MGSTIQRFIQFIENQGYSKRQAEVKLGMGNGRLGKMLKSNTEIKGILLENILRKFPSLSRNWLLQGEGEMTVQNVEDPILNESGIAVSAEKERTISVQERYIAHLEGQISDLLGKYNKLEEKLIEKDNEIKGLQERIERDAKKISAYERNLGNSNPSRSKSEIPAGK